MTGVEHRRVRGAAEAQVVSCNTHALAALLRCFTGERLQGLVASDFVIVRRSEDLGKSDRLVGANVVARHRDAERGTHHASDVGRLFGEIGVDPIVTSSDITTPSQLLHSVRFRIRANRPIDVEALRRHPWIATTQRFDSDAVFERGRRTGFEGRVWAHAVVVDNNLMVHGDEVFGWAFVPQEANSIPSTVHAWLLQCEVPDADARMAAIEEALAVRRI